MKRFRRVLSVAVTLILIVTLFSDSLSAAFISAGPGAADPVNDGIVGTVEGDDLDSADPAGDNSALPPPEQTGDPSADPSADPNADPNVVPSSDPNVDPNSGLSNEILGDPVDESLGGEYGIMPIDGGTLVTPSASLWVDGHQGTEVSENSNNVEVHFDWNFGSATDIAGFEGNFQFSMDFLDLSKNGGTLSGTISKGGVDYGSYTITQTSDGHYNLYVKMNDNATNVTDFGIQVQTTLPGDPTSKNDGDKFKFEFDYKTYEYEWKDESSSMTLTKTPNGSFTLDRVDGDKYYFVQQYTIEAVVDGKVFDFTLHDVLTNADGFNGVVKDFHVERSANPTDAKDPDVDQAMADLNLDPLKLFNSADGVPMGDLYNGDRLTYTYTIEYEVDKTLAQKILKGESNFDANTNTVKWKYNNYEFGNSEFTPDVETKPSGSFNFKVSKTGTAPYEREDGWYIDWTVKFDISNAADFKALGVEAPYDAEDAKKIFEFFGINPNKFKDTLGADLSFVDSSFSLFDYTKAAIDSNGDIVFSYSTKITNDDHVGKFENTFTYTDGDGEHNVGEPADGFDSQGDSIFKDEGSPSISRDNGYNVYNWVIDYKIAHKNRGEKVVEIIDTPAETDASGWDTNYYQSILKDSVKITYYTSDGVHSNVELKDIKAKSEISNPTDDDLYYEYDENGKSLKIHFPKSCTHGDIHITLSTVFKNDAGDIAMGPNDANVYNAANGVRKNIWSTTTNDYQVSKSATTVSEDNTEITWESKVENAAKKLDEKKIVDQKYVGLLYNAAKGNGLEFTDEIDFSGNYIEFIPDSFEIRIKGTYNELTQGVAVDGETKQFVLKDGEKISPYDYVIDLLKKDFNETYQYDKINNPKKITFRIKPETLNKILKLRFTNNSVEDSQSFFEPGGWLNDPSLEIVIKYKTKLTDLEQFYKDSSNGSIKVGNTMSLTDEGDYYIPGVAETYVQHKGEFEKKGYYDAEENTINSFYSEELYTNFSNEAKEAFNETFSSYHKSKYSGVYNYFYAVEVNKYAENMGNKVYPDADYMNSRLVVTDTLGKSLRIIPESIRVYYYDAATNQYKIENDWRYKMDEDGDTISINVPDSKHLYVTYWVNVIAEDAGSGNLKVTDAKNTVKMAVYGDASKESHTGTDQVNKTSSYVNVAASVSVEKYFEYEIDNEVFEKSLNESGVEFSLHYAKYDSATGKLSVGDLVPKDVATQTGLTFTFNAEPDDNQIFVLVEDKLPNNFTVGEKDYHFGKKADPVYFVFDNYKGVLPEGVTKFDTDTVTIRVKNEPSTDDKTSLKVTKTVEKVNPDGIDAPNVKFTFHVYLSDETATADNFTLENSTRTAEDFAVTTGTDAEGRYFEFSIYAGETVSINDLAVGTEYTVKEVVIPKNFTCDLTTQNGNLSSAGNVQTAKFVNKFTSSTSADVSFDKKIVTNYGTISDKLKEELRKKTFTFDLKDKDGNTIKTANVSGADLVDGQQTVTFEDIETYVKNGTYTYTISERGAGTAGWTYSTDIIYVNVDVTADTDGTLTATVEYRNAPDGTYGSEVLSLTNNYEAKAEATPELTKEFDGEWKTDEKTFIFNYEISGDPADGVTSESELIGFVLNDADGKITLPKLTFTKPGKYTVEVTEDQTSKKSGVIYDGEKITITYYVTDNGNGTLSVSDPTYSKGTKTGNDTKKFVNKKTTDAVVTIPVAKKYEGDEGNNSTFNFTIEYTSGGEIDGYNITNSTISVSADSGSSSAVTSTEEFGITFSKVGTYKFTIKEVPGTDKNIKYDTKGRVVTIEVTDNDNDGVFETKTTLDDGSKVAMFTNDYTKPKVPVADVKVDVSKKLEGREFGDADRFVFNITVPNGAPKPKKDGKEINSLTITKDNQSDSFSLHFDADALGLDSADKSIKFEYRIVEEHSGEKIDGVTYDSSTKLVTVEVTRKAGENGAPDTLEVKVNNRVTNSASLEFTNTYSASGLFAVVAEKKLYNIEDDVEKLVNNITRTFNFKLTATGEKEKEILTRNGGQSDTITINGEEVQAVSKSVSNLGGRIEFKDLKVLPGDISSSPLSFILTEQVGTEKGMEYDTSVKNITVTLRDQGDGTISCSVTPSEGTKDLVFINKYTKPEGSIQFGVTKALEGSGDWSSITDTKYFKFILSEDGTEIRNATVAVAKGSATIASFEPIEYLEEDIGTHTYTISEVGEVNEKGVPVTDSIFTCDDNVYTVTVEVNYVGGKLVPTIKSVTKANGESVEIPSHMTFTFTNEYNVTEASAVLKVAKDFKGNGNWENITDSFTFNLYESDKDWNQGNLPLDTKTLKYSGNLTETVTFAEQNNLTVGTYYYIIEEAEISNSNITSSGPIHVTVNVTDNGAGKLEAKVKYNGNAAPATITNTFNTEVKPEFKVKKVISDNWPSDGVRTFEFGLYKVLPDGSEEEVDTVDVTVPDKASESDYVSFDMTDFAAYKSADVEKFIIKELGTAPAGVTFDKPKEITVTTSYDTDGTLKVEYSSPNGNAVTFTNTYKSSGKFGLKAKKEVPGGEFAIEAEAFSFTLTATNDAAKALLTKYKLDNPLKRSNDSDGNVDFGSFTVNSADELEFTINEVKGSIPGMKYDDKPHTVVVTFKDDGKGTLTPTITVDGDETTEAVILTITNTYTKPTTETEIKVKKTLEGRDWKTGDEFTFTLTGSAGAPMPENYAPITITSTTPDKTASFGTIKYTIEDLGGENSKEFTYTVTEDATTKIPGVVYDASTYTVTVTVTLNDGVLTASKSIAKDGEPAGSIEFTNEFKNTTAHFEATKTVKTVSGNAKTVADYNGKFTFTLKAETENAPMPAKITAANDGEGKVVFGDITYNAPGTYRYIIEEDGGDENGIFYSESVYRATVVVTTADDNSLTASEPTYELQSADGKTYTLAPNAAFENDYTAPYGSLTLNGTKKFAKNSESAAPTITNPLTFVFDVYAEATGSLLYSVPVSVDNISGEYTIEKLLDLNFDESNIGKTYRYKIVERAIDANDKAYAGFAKDNAEYIVEVKVGEPDRYNVITSTYTITKDGEKADDIVFTNTYTALTASTSVTVNKNLTGRGWLGGDKFEFTLTSATGEVAKKTVSSADEKAQFDFGPYTIEDVGTYTYTLAETNGGKTINGVKYDDSEYTVTVKVAYADGKLTATPTIANVTGTNVTFTNKYAASGSFSLTAKKIYKENGSEVEIGGKKFTFGLTSVDNDIISAELTATNNGNDVSFGPFSIPAPGTYKFSLREIVTDPVAGMTYDTEVREITVVATDNNKGGYNITVNGNPAAAENNTGVTFTNEYNYNGFSVTKTVEGTKGVEERETLDFGFKVTLTYNDAPFTGAVKADKEIVSEGDGVYTFTLKHGETVNFSEIPYGVKYFVEETEAHGYTKSAENAEGVVDKDAHEAKFVNFKDKDKVGLSLTKIVTGTDGETERLFNFTVTLTQPLTGRYGELEFTEGVAHVAIKSGDTVSVTGLPADIGYTVTEAEANTEDYFTTVVNATSEGIPEGTTAEVVFTNHRDRKLGGLSVSKTVSGTDPDYNKSFNFTVTLNDTSINGMYGQMYFVNGSANITLAHGQTVVADGLPAGVGYTVYEYNSDDFEVSAFGNTGVIPENSYARASFVNTRDKKFGDLSVSKTVDGDEGWDPEQTFEFTVTLSDSTVEGVYGGMTFAGGIAHVVLKAGETATATRLPEGITYTVTEAPVEDFTQSATGDSGVIVADTTASAVFVNTYEAKKLGNLSVTKTVSGDAADMTKVFGFRVILSDAEINGLYGDMYFENGFANIYLSHGQTATAIGLPEGIGYSVIELDSEDYIVTATGTAGFIIADYTVPVSFNNHKDQPDIPEVPEEDERHGDDSLAGVGRDRPTGDDSLAGVGMDDMNPATGDYEAESFANGTSAIVILWTMVFLFGAVVIARKRREDR